MPPEIVNGEIPRNKYGNIDIYTQSMIPVGAVHLPLKGSARVAKKLKISYADAVTGFEFGSECFYDSLRPARVALLTKG